MYVWYFNTIWSSVYGTLKNNMFKCVWNVKKQNGKVYGTLKKQNGQVCMER